MIRMILAFLVVFLVFYFGIDLFRHLTGLEKWNLTKSILYSILCAALTIFTLTLVVILF